MDLLCGKLKSEFGIKLSKGTLDRILNDKFYYGIMTWNGKEYPHKYPQIIDKALFDKVKETRSRFHKKKFKYAGKPYIYRGIFRCNKCDRSISAETQKGHTYYHCTKRNDPHGLAWSKEEELTNELGKIFKQMQVPKNITQQIIDNLNKAHKNKIEFHNKNFDELTQKHKTLSKAQDNLYLDKLKGSITDERYY